MSENNPSNHVRSVRRRPTGTRNRRGVLLLVVLSMLVMFMMTGVAFVVIAKHYADVGKSVSKTDTVAASQPANLLESALYDILRDTTNPTSRVRYHSLLRDLYGSDGFAIDNQNGGLTSARSMPATGHQFIELGVTYNSSMLALASIVDYYNGRVLTMIDGPARGLSGRIVGYRPTSTGQARFLVTAFQAETAAVGSVLPNPHSAAGATPPPYDGDRFIVNGAPFNGTGFGYDRTSTPLLSAIEKIGAVDRHVALMPNGSFLDPELLDPTFLMTKRELGVATYPTRPTTFGDLTQAHQNLFRERLANLGLAGLGGSDESYDAADYQNMLLALVPTDPELPDNPVTPMNVSDLVQPSLHRRALINYWERLLEATPNTLHFSAGPNDAVPLTLQQAALARKVVLRPLAFDHPNFPKLENAVHGPWDVDNDGDGVPDSIWVDFGYPVMKDADGRRFKPMFAILCQDLDGRLNVNAHGSREEGDPTRVRIDSAVLAGAVGVTSFQRPRGQGYGPAEISLRPLLGDDYTRFLYGDEQYVGRYGADKMPGWEGIGINAVNGRPAYWDTLAQMRFSRYPLYYGWDTWRRGFLTPPDLKGWFGLGVDFNGQPNFGFRGAGNPQLNFVDPEELVAESAYESNLLANGSYGSTPTAADSLFSVSELESVLRMFDADVGKLPERLRSLGSLSEDDRQLITTHSFDLPVASVALTADLRSIISNLDFSLSPLDAVPQATVDRLQKGAQLTVIDLLMVRILKAAADNPTAPLPDINQAMHELLAQDLVDGLRMDLNRPFGDGRDNNGDLAVDDRDEAVRDYASDASNADGMESPIAVDAVSIRTGSLPGAAPQPAYAEVGLDHSQGVDADGNGFLDADDRRLARQLYARQLFVLAMTLIDEQYLETGFPTVNGGHLTKQQSINRLAQWAVNVVDFRDPDAIMTGFEYDLNPFDGWDVDGDVSDTDGPDGVAGNQDDDNIANRRVVWGCERPHLLLTETLAFHDMRCVDSKFDPSGKDHYKESYNPASDDTNLDQYRVPQGSAFFELMCVGNPNNAVMPGELYRYDAGLGKWVLELGKTTASGNDPVWRLAISEWQEEYEESAIGRLSDRDGNVEQNKHKPETTTFQPDAMELDNLAKPRTSEKLKIERYVTFTQTEPNGEMADKTYWNDDGPVAELPAGQYAVVGPRRETVISSKTDANHSDSEHTITLDPTATPEVNVDHAGFPLSDRPAPDFLGTDANVKPAVAIVAAIPVSGFPDDSGVNVSEPLPGAAGAGYYTPLPPGAVNGEYGSLTGPPGDQMLDQPEDLRPGRPIEELAEGTNPLGTHTNYRTVFLQRLADPTLPWNPKKAHADHNPNRPVNPYLTVDWQPLDLTVFNGEDNATDSERLERAGVLGEIDDNNAGWAREDDYFFATRERGARRVAGSREKNLWRAWTPKISDPELPDSRLDHTTSFFRHNLVHTLGYLNKAYGDPLVGALPDFLGAPQEPFPWLTWNDRPFVSSLELMQVPLSSPGRLTFDHTWVDVADSKFTQGKEAYEPTDKSADQNRITNPNSAFGHLMNFFAADATVGNAPNLYRLLELTGVPSRFVGTEMHLNPVAFANGNGIDDGTQHRRPPFNRISTYREPGKINLNTIVDPRVFYGIFHGDPSTRSTADPTTSTIHPGPNLQASAASRRGYAGGGGDLFVVNNNFPTFFANPFRSSAAGAYVPLSGGMSAMEREGVECTLLRSESQNATPTAQPLFRFSSADPTPDFENTDRNPYFRYQPAQRLANMTTTRSNVYAIWMTVGYFEVEALRDGDATSDPIIQRYGTNLNDARQNSPIFNKIYSEGLMLGAELGADTGDVERHRSFSIIDRSIPVGFEPGQDHNVDKAILLNRVIE